MEGSVGANSEVWLSLPTGDFFSAATAPAVGLEEELQILRVSRDLEMTVLLISCSSI